MIAKERKRPKTHCDEAAGLKYPSLSGITEVLIIIWPCRGFCIRCVQVDFFSSGFSIHGNLMFIPCVNINELNWSFWWIVPLVTNIKGWVFPRAPISPNGMVVKSSREGHLGYTDEPQGTTITGSTLLSGMCWCLATPASHCLALHPDAASGPSVTPVFWYAAFLFSRPLHFQESLWLYPAEHSLASKKTFSL